MCRVSFVWDEDLCTLISRRVSTEQVLHAKPKTEHTRGVASTTPVSW